MNAEVRQQESWIWQKKEILRRESYSENIQQRCYIDRIIESLKQSVFESWREIGKNRSKVSSVEKPWREDNVRVENGGLDFFHFSSLFYFLLYFISWT